MRNIFSRFLFFVGLLSTLLLGLLMYQRYRPNALAFHMVTQPSVIIASANDHTLPIRIHIPNVSIDLPITEAAIHGNSWETTTRGASHLSTSPLPGERGNAIFYGHNWPSLLGNLKNVAVGDTITITLSNGSALQYTVKFITIVTPDQTKILENSDDSRLTIYTCTGLLDSKRFVVTALRN